jgi:MFS family permease
VILIGGYNLLFGVLAAIAALAAVAAAVLVPHVAPSPPRTRPTIVDFVRRTIQVAFLRPVLLLGAVTAALSAGVGFLPVLGAQHHLDSLATGALVSLLAGTATVLQPGAGRWVDGGRFRHSTGVLALLACSVGFIVAAGLPGAPGIAIAGVLIGAGVAIGTPLGFTLLAEWTPPGRLGSTMGAAEVGRELGDAGGPVLVGAFAFISLAAGFAALAGVLAACAALVAPRANSRVAAHSQDPRTEKLSGS